MCWVDGGQEIGGGKDLEVAVDLGIEAGAVDDEVTGRFQGHLFHREGVAEDRRGCGGYILGEVLQVGLGLGRHSCAVQN
jgi:hypothetical protein